MLKAEVNSEQSCHHIRPCFLPGTPSSLPFSTQAWGPPKVPTSSESSPQDRDMRWQGKKLFGIKMEGIRETVTEGGGWNCRKSPHPHWKSLGPCPHLLLF